MSERRPTLYVMVQVGLCEQETFKERPDEGEGGELCRNLHGKGATQQSSQPDWAESITEDRILQSGKELREKPRQVFLAALPLLLLEWPQFFPRGLDPFQQK